MKNTKAQNVPTRSKSSKFNDLYVTDTIATLADYNRKKLLAKGIEPFTQCRAQLAAMALTAVEANEIGNYVLKLDFYVNQLHYIDWHEAYRAMQENEKARINMINVNGFTIEELKGLVLCD